MFRRWRPLRHLQAAHPPRQRFLSVYLRTGRRVISSILPAALASNILYDCEGFVCAGFPSLTISVGDSLCSVMSSILTTLCDLTDNQFSIVNVGLGAPIWKGTTSGVAELRSLTAGTGITITPSADEIEIASVFSTPYNALELETLATTIQVFAFPLTAANTVPALELSIPSNGNYYITGTANITISHSETSNFFFRKNPVP